ncbi:MAG: M23 family metallopeptidase [Pseudomonadota bacterium]
MAFLTRLVPALAALILAACATTDRSGEDDAASSAATPPSGLAPGFVPEPELMVCPRLTISNAPRTDADGRVTGYAPFALVDGQRILINPAPKSCLSSNFGMRRGKLHKGIDLQSSPAGPVVAAGSGTVVEAGYRDDYGTYVLIQHSETVFTRYAHLQSRTNEAQEGATVQTGTVLGIMGNTASYSIPIHLHYEVLTGDYDTPKGAFGLTPQDILTLAER